MIVDPDGRPRDQLGRIVLHRINVLGWARALPGLLDLFEREVPGPRIHAMPDGGTAIDCHCGAAHELPPPPGLSEAECGRWFLETLTQVRVYRP